MKRLWIVLLLVLVFCGRTYAPPVPPFVTIYMRTLLDDADAATARATLEIILTEFAPLILAERSSDPDKPAEGKAVVWLSDGTGYGDDGDVIVASTAAGVTRRVILFDHSVGDVWNDFLLIEGDDFLLIEGGDKLIIE